MEKKGLDMYLLLSLRFFDLASQMANPLYTEIFRYFSNWISSTLCILAPFQNQAF